MFPKERREMTRLFGAESRKISVKAKKQIWAGKGSRMVRGRVREVQ